MAWNPYQDQKNRAYSGILTSLFPEQTRTLPRILIWSLIFLADLIGVFGSAVYLGFMENLSDLGAGVLLVLCVILFWLQGKLWYGITGLFSKKEETWL